MIIDLPNTKTKDIERRIRALREERGDVTSGRVLTLIVVTSEDDDLDRIISSTHDASREHPARVIVLVTHRSEESLLDAQLRIGGDAGASEIIVMHLHGELSANRASVVTPLLLPDTPIVAWWPGTGPRNPAADPIGALATRRITDSLTDEDEDALYRRRMTYTRGDSDMVWSRITLWRGLLASALDQPPHHPIVSAEVWGPKHDPSVDIAAGWLAERLDVPLTRHVTVDGRYDEDAEGNRLISIEKAVLYRQVGAIEVEVIDANTVSLTVGDQKSMVTLGRRALADCLAEELRHLDPDYAFGHALRGLVRVNRPDRGPRTSQYRGVQTPEPREDKLDRWTSRDARETYNTFDGQESLR